MADSGHDFQMIDPIGDRALMCNDCLACKCCDAERAAAPCTGEPQGIK